MDGRPHPLRAPRGSGVGDSRMSAPSPSPNAVDTLQRFRRDHHPRCFVGRAENSFGLGIHYTVQPAGHVEATTPCPLSWEGYPGLVHGGIIASLLDGAMTNSLFSRGIVAVTAEMKIRYRHPVILGETVTIRGEVTCVSPPLFVAEARILQGGRVLATCTGKFLPPDRTAGNRRSESPDPRTRTMPLPGDGPDGGDQT